MVGKAYVAAVAAIEVPTSFIGSKI